MKSRDTVITVELEESAGRFTLREICERGQCHAEFVIKLVSYGVLTPVEERRSARDWAFDSTALLRLRKAQRLQRDLNMNLPGLAMALDLLDEVEGMRREIDRLNHQLSRLLSD